MHSIGMCYEISPQRADLILRVLKWGRPDLAKRYNRLRGTKHTAKHVWLWFNGRGLPESIQTFLRMEIHAAQERRRRQRKMPSAGGTLAERVSRLEAVAGPDALARLTRQVAIAEDVYRAKHL